VSEPTFLTSLRGYDRQQVDEYLRTQSQELDRLRAEIADLGQRLRQANDHAQATERENRELRARTAQAPAEEGFGFRAEKLLRLAEQEATELREAANRDAASLLEKARTEAEQHRHEVEQQLITRNSQLEQQATQRAAELAEREQQIADQLVAAREQAEQVTEAASRTAERLRREAEAAAADTRQRAEHASRQVREQAEQEVARLGTVQSDVRAELSRLADVLSAELKDGLLADVPPQPART
jgi:cell division septum initiation protein DivIVA